MIQPVKLVLPPKKRIHTLVRATKSIREPPGTCARLPLVGTKDEFDQAKLNKGDGIIRNLIQLQHHVDDYECMWNGIEDLYIGSTNETLPPSFFFVLSGFGSFCYMKTSKAKLKRMVALGDGRTAKMYEFLSPIVGFAYKHFEHKTFEKALLRAKAEITHGYPCVIGALDMFYLPYYEKLYHKEHIPFHYVMMTGYDDQAQCIYLNDCGKAEIQTLPYAELRLAWNCSYPGLSKPNTVCTVRMNSSKNKYEIAKEALSKKRELFLNPPVGFIGYRGLCKFIADLPNWRNELSKEEYDRILANMVEFFGTVPTVPNALCGIDKPDEVAFCGGFDKVGKVLLMLGLEYGDKKMTEAAHVFAQGADVISRIKDVIVDYLVDKQDNTDELTTLFKNLAEIMKRGFLIL